MTAGQHSGTPTAEQAQQMEEVLRGMDAEQQQAVATAIQEAHAAGSGTDAALYGAAERPPAAGEQLPFQFVLKGDQASSGAMRPTRVRPLPQDAASATTVIGQPTMRLEAATLNPAQQADESVSEWTLPPEYQDTISAFYKRTEGAAQ